MCDQQSLRSACAYAQSDQSLCWSLEYSMNLLTEHHLDFKAQKGTAQARLSLHLTKCHIVGNHMSRLIYDIMMVHVLLIHQVESGSTVFIHLREFFLTYPIPNHGKDKSLKTLCWKTSDVINDVTML